MASPFEVELSTPQAPSEVESRAADSLTDAAGALGLRLSKQSPGELQYKPRVQFPILLALWRTLRGEHMTVTFSAGSDGGTKVTIRGTIPSDRQAMASDPEHWTGALGGTAARS